MVLVWIYWAKADYNEFRTLVIRFIFGLRAKYNVKHKFPELRWLNVQNRQTYHIAFLTLANPIISIGNFHPTRSHASRQKNVLNISKHLTVLFKRGSSYLVPRMFNTYVNDNLNLYFHQFKHKINNRMFSKSYCIQQWEKEESLFVCSLFF